MGIRRRTQSACVVAVLVAAAWTAYAWCRFTGTGEFTSFRPCFRRVFVITAKCPRLSPCYSDAESRLLRHADDVRLPVGFLVPAHPRANGQRRGVCRRKMSTTECSRHPFGVRQFKSVEAADQQKSRSRQHFLHALQRETGVQSLRMLTAPPGSALESELRVILNDPIQNLPWDQYVPFYKQYGRGPDNAYLHFLQGNWTFIETLTYSEVSAGVIDGGPENYTGEGTSLPFHPLSIDRQSSVPWPQQFNHGVGYRESRDTPFAVRLDRLPDGNQDIYFGEDDEELEARLWGSWDAPQAMHEVHPETEDILVGEFGCLCVAWRDANPDDDLTGMVTPWTQKFSGMNEMPLHCRLPSSGPPSASPEMELAARGRFAGYLTATSPHHADAIEQCRHRHRLEATAPPQKKKFPTQLRNLNRSQQEAFVNAELKEMTDEIIRAHWADIRTHPVYIRAVIDGATHEAAVKAAMEVNAGRGSQDAKRLISAFDSAEGLEKQERLDHEVEGQVNPPDAKGKTIAVNLAAPRPAAYHESVLSPHSTVAEHEELYHFFLTEMHREGRYRDFHSFMAAEEDLRYSQRHERRNFPRLMAHYRPLWTMRKYGEEFGAALRPEECLEDKPFSVFGDSISWKPAVPLQNGTAPFTKAAN